MATCQCDMFPVSHAEYSYVVLPDGTLQECEKRLRIQHEGMLSPHLFPNARFAHDPWRGP